MHLKKEIEFLRAERNKGAKEFDIAKKNTNSMLESFQKSLKDNNERIAAITVNYNRAMEDFNNIFYYCQIW